MRKKIRYGIIGFGRFADKTIAPAIKQSHNSELIAIQNRSKEKAQRLAAEHGVPLAFDSAEALAAHPDVDVVFITSPNSLHCDETIISAKAGKHVLVEKPMANSVQECEKMIAACAEHNVRLMVGHMIRLSPAVNRVKQIISSRGIGEVIHAEANFIYDGRLSTREWLTDRNVAGGGPLFDVGVHCLDTLRFILHDEVASVKAELQPKPTDVTTEISADVLLRFTRETMGSIFCSYASSIRQSYLEVLGTEGRLSVVDFTVGNKRLALKIEKSGGNEQSEPLIEEIDVPNLYIDEVNLFSDSILNGIEHQMTAENGLMNLRVLEDVMRSQIERNSMIVNRIGPVI